MAEPAHRHEEKSEIEAQATEQPAPAVSEADQDAEASGKKATLDLESGSGKGQLDIAGAFQLIAARHGRSYNQILIEIAKLAFGPGKLKVDEYLDLGLYDDKLYTMQDKRAFVGLDMMREIWSTVNYKMEWIGLLENKLAATTLLGAFGFPTIPTRGLYSETFELPAINTFTSADALADFLRDRSQYPLFGKPSDAFQSIGSASLAAYEPDTDSIVMLHGNKVPVAEFAEEIATAYASGYILQGRLDPHPEIERVCGARLATCRVVTIRGENGIEVVRSLWKIAGGRNVADNFWRSGNMLGQLDMETGEVLRVQQGAGVAASSPEVHPDTGTPIVGFKIPHFAEIKELACRAHAVFKDINLIGWDIASTADGPVIVEPNISPDFFLPQVIDRRGMLDEPMQALIKRCREAKTQSKKMSNKDYRAQLRASRNRITSAALKS